MTAPSFLSFTLTVDAEAGMTAHSQLSGPATKAQPIADAPMYDFSDYVWMVCCSALSVWCVIENRVLSIYRVQPGCKFYWLLGYAPYIRQAHRVAHVVLTFPARS